MRKLAQLVFRAEGFQVLTMADGDEACALAPRLKPDIVISDITVGATTGYDVAEFVKTHLPGTPVILLTGTRQPLDFDRIDLSGTDCIATKPFHATALSAKIRELIHVPPPLGTPLTLPLGGADQRLTVFLCHANEDKPTARQLYQRLKVAGFSPWLDEKDLLPGQDWNLTIQNILRTVDAVVVCLSSSAVSKAGYVQKEISFALDVLAEKPEGTLFLVPVLIDSCQIPQRLRHLHAASISEDDGLEKLIRALRVRAIALGRSSQQARQ
jgi:DNA-binding response OmpR family regulator